MLLQQTAVQSSILFLSRTVDRISHLCYSNRQLSSPPTSFCPPMLIRFCRPVQLKRIHLIQLQLQLGIVPALCWKNKNDEQASRAWVDQYKPAPRPSGCALGPPGRFLLTHPCSAGRFITDSEEEALSSSPPAIYGFRSGPGFLVAEEVQGGAVEEDEMEGEVGECKMKKQGC